MLVVEPDGSVNMAGYGGGNLQRSKYSKEYNMCVDYCKKTGDEWFYSRDVFPKGGTGAALRMLRDIGALKSKRVGRKLLVWKVV